MSKYDGIFTPKQEAILRAVADLIKPQIIDAEFDWTSLKHTPLTPTEISLISYYDELGRQAVEQAIKAQAHK